PSGTTSNPGHTACVAAPAVPATGPWTTATLAFFLACSVSALGVARRRRDSLRPRRALRAPPAGEARPRGGPGGRRRGAARRAAPRHADRAALQPVRLAARDAEAPREARELGGDHGDRLRRLGHGTLLVFR